MNFALNINQRYFFLKLKLQNDKKFLYCENNTEKSTDCYYLKVLNDS